MRGTLKLIWINRVGITDSELPPEATRSADSVSTAAADSVGMAQEAAVQGQAATVPIQAMAADVRRPRPHEHDAGGAGVGRRSDHRPIRYQVSASLGQRLRAFAWCGNLAECPAAPTYWAAFKIRDSRATRLRLRNDVNTLATTAMSLPGGAGLSRRISDAQSAAGRFSRQTTGAVSAVESARTRAAGRCPVWRGGAGPGGAAAGRTGRARKLEGR